MAPRLYWEDRAGRVYGRIVDRRPLDPGMFTVRWDDGRTGTFVEGHEPDELHIAREVQP